MQTYIPYKHFLITAVTLIVLSFGALVSYGQVLNGSDMISGFEKRKNDALQKLNTKPRPDTARVNALLDLLATSYFQKQREALIEYWNEAYTLSKKLQYPKGLFHCYFWKANYSRGLGDIKGFHLYTDSAFLYTENVEMEHRARVHRLKGLQYQQEENYYAALKHYFSALGYMDPAESEQSLFIYQNMTSAYSNLDILDKAEEYAKKGAVLADKINAPTNLKLQANSTLASIYLRNNNTNEARIYLDKMAPYMPDTVELAITSNYYLDKGLLHFIEQRYDSSYYFYLTGYQIAKASPHKINQYGAINYLFKNALKLGDIKLAKLYVDEGMESAKESGKVLNIITALYNFSSYYHSIGNEKKAYEALEKSTTLKDSFLLATNYSNLNHLYVLYETEKKQNEIQLLKNDKKIQDIELKRKTILNTIYIIIAIALFIIIVLSLRYFKIKAESESQKQKIQQQKIVELEKDRQLIAVDAMLKGQEEERSRVAKDLHDGLGSMLTGAKHSFVNLRERILLNGEQKERFDRSIGLLNTTIFDLKKVAQNLMPATLSEFGLAEAVRDFCHSIESTTGIKVEFQVLGEKRILEKTAETFCYRIIQELVNNAVKYADASEIFVELLISNKKINITVEDNGIGFDSAILATSKGSGMKNIQYRVDYFSGTLDIDTAPGEGTTVYIMLNA